MPCGRAALRIPQASVRLGGEVGWGRWCRMGFRVAVRDESHGTDGGLTRGQTSENSGIAGNAASVTAASSTICK